MRLSYKKRMHLRKSTFAIKKGGKGGKGKYPITDRKHAGNAKARAKQMLKKGKLSQAGYNRVVAKANRFLKTKKGKK